MDVIALISGGKDSFYNILHCIKNGHKIVALANLYPPLPSQLSHESSLGSFVTACLPEEDAIAIFDDGAPKEEAQDELDSFMYQTVGYKLIPLYASALNLPLYRIPILGSSANQDLSYSVTRPQTNEAETAVPPPRDETEDLYNLLSHVLISHPTAKAVSTGAILSTYQRTRVESVCSRLGLISLAYLWQRPQVSILAEMASAGIDAKIVKVAAQGLDPDKWLWQSATSPGSIHQLTNLQNKYGVHAAGEGGEYETIVVNGPGFRRIIKVEEDHRRIVRCRGGVGYLKISKAELEGHGERYAAQQNEWSKNVNTPPVLDESMWQTLSLMRILNKEDHAVKKALPLVIASRDSKLPNYPVLSSTFQLRRSISINNVTAKYLSPAVDGIDSDIGKETENVMEQLSGILSEHNTSFSRITSITLLLRRISDFPLVNEIYGKYFVELNPPARVCVGLGECIPCNRNIMLHAQVDVAPVISPWELDGSFSAAGARKALHVQSRSYWAPANIGPYSQGISVDGLVSLSGQIPLMPANMELPTLSDVPVGGELQGRQRLLEFQSVLALQHLLRVARAMQVEGFVMAIGYTTSEDAVTHMNKALDISIWKLKKALLWGTAFDPEESHHREDQITDGNDWIEERMLQNDASFNPAFIVLVDSLPRNASVEYAALGIDGPWTGDRARDLENIDFHDFAVRLREETRDLALKVEDPEWRIQRYQVSPELETSTNSQVHNVDANFEIDVRGAVVEWGSWDDAGYSDVGPCGGRVQVVSVDFKISWPDINSLLQRAKSVVDYILKSIHPELIQIKRTKKWQLKPLSVTVYLPRTTLTPNFFHSVWENACNASLAVSWASSLLQIIPVKKVWMGGKERDVIYMIRFAGDGPKEHQQRVRPT